MGKTNDGAGKAIIALFKAICKKRLTNRLAVTSIVGIFAVFEFMRTAQAGALSLAAGTTTNVTGPADTIDGLTQKGAKTANLNFDLSGDGATSRGVEISGFSSVNLGSVTATGTNSPQDTATLTDRAISLNINGDIKGATGNASASPRLNIVINPSDAARFGMVYFKGNVDTSTHVSLQAGTSPTLTKTVIAVVGNTTTPTSFSGTIDMQGTGINFLAVFKGSTISGAIDLAAAPSSRDMIYLLKGAVVGGPVSNSNTLGSAQVFVIGDTTIGMGSSSFIVNSTSLSTIAISQKATLNLAGSGAVKIDRIQVGGYWGNSTLLVSGNGKTITAAIDGGGYYGSGTLAISGGGTTTLAGPVGMTRSLKEITLASGTKVDFQGDINANTMTISNTSTNTFAGNTSTYISLKADSTIAVTANKSIFGQVYNNTGSNAQGTLSFAQTTSDTTLISGTVGATSTLKSVNSSAQSGTATFGSLVRANVINVGSGAGTIVFARGAQVASLNAGGTGTVKLGGDLTATQRLSFSAAGNVTVDADKKIVGSVTTTNNDQGTLKFSGATTATTLVSGNIGTPAKALLKVTAGGNGGVASFGGNIYAKSVDIANTLPSDTVKFTGAVTAATALDFSTDGIVDFNGTTDQVLMAPITASAGAGKGDVTVSNIAGTVNFASVLGANGAHELGTVTLKPGTRTVFASSVNVGDLVISGKKVTFNGKVTVTNTGAGDGTLKISDGTTLEIGTGFTNGDTVIAASGNVTDAGTIAVKMPSSIRNGQSLNIVTGASGVGTASYKATGSLLFTYAATLTNDTAVSVTATRRSVGSLSNILNISARESTILYNANAATGGDAEAAQAILAAIAEGGTAAREAAAQMSPKEDTMGAVDRTQINTGGNVFNIVSNRLASMRVGKMYASKMGATGFSTGDVPLNGTGWFKAFGNRSTQATVKTVKGFKADTYGSDFGMDGDITDNSRLGASFSFARTSVYGYGSAKEQTNTKSYQLTLYGDYTADHFFITGMAGYALNKNETTRTIALSGLNRMANGNYNSNQFMLSVRGGIPFVISDNLFFTPAMGLSWTYVRSDGYTETGAGSLNLKMNPNSVNAVIASLGGTAHMQFQAGHGYLIPEVSAGMSYDLVGDAVSATGQFTGGGTTFKTTGAKFAQLAENAGLGLTYDDGAWSISGNYDGKFKKGYRSSSGTLEARVKF